MKTAKPQRMLIIGKDIVNSNPNFSLQKLMKQSEQMTVIIPGFAVLEGGGVVRLDN